jgi:hypothetical protein
MRARFSLGHYTISRILDIYSWMRSGEAKKAEADPDFIPKSKVVKTGTDCN